MFQLILAFQKADLWSLHFYLRQFRFISTTCLDRPWSSQQVHSVLPVAHMRPPNCMVSSHYLPWPRNIQDQSSLLPAHRLPPISKLLFSNFSLTDSPVKCYTDLMIQKHIPSTPNTIKFCYYFNLQGLNPLNTLRNKTI